MRKIILASGSRARRRLLRRMGLDPIVVRTSAAESRSLKKGCARLVVANAAKKARYAAKVFDSGVIIAADTVVLAGRKIIGKPRNKKDAVRTLRRLSGKTQLVYTGLAVLDIDNKKAFTAYEKTKIYMRRLDENRINGYFKKISPLDKAGGFNIEGRGRMLIGRIKGSFSNVVGLPIEKLAVILRKIGLNIPKNP